MNEALWGCIAGLCTVAGLFFLRFWKQTRDRLFALFSLAFATLCLNYTLLVVCHPPKETRHFFAIPRFVAFVLILGAVIDKNRRKESGRKND